MSATVSKITLKTTLIILSSLLNWSLSAEDGSIAVQLLDEEISLLVPVKMFGSTNYFLIDTGSTVTGLDIRHKDRLGEVIRLWDGQSLYRSPEIEIGSVRLPIHEVFCADFKMFRSITGKECDGVLGMDFLKDHVVELDFDQEILRIGSEPSKQDQKDTTTVPLQLSNNRHFSLAARLGDKGQPINLLIDTGDSGTVTLGTAAWESLFPSNHLNAVSRVMVAGPMKKTTESVITRLSKIALDESNVYSNALCVLGAHQKAPNALGLGFWRKHRVILDFPRHTLYLRPGRNFQVPEVHDMSGLHLLWNEDHVFVHSVDDGSPGALAGVQPGDFLIKLNDMRCSDSTMKEMRAQLRSEDGRKVSLQMIRRDKTFNIEFKLRRVL